MPTNGYAISFDTTTTPTTYNVVDQDSSTTVASGNYTSGQAMEEINAEITGNNLRIAVNSKFFMEALKVMREPQVLLAFNGPSGHMAVRRIDSEGFLCLIAPINLSEQELKMDEIDSSGDNGL